MKPALSIVIVSYNVKTLLHHCIESAFHYFPLSTIEVIVVDNNSSDETVEMIRREFRDCVVIDNKSNAGFSEANNQGMRVAKGDFILLLNPDTEFMNDSVNKLLPYLSENSNVSIVAPRLLNTNGSLQVSCWKFPTVWNLIGETFFFHQLMKIGQYPLEKFQTSFETDFASGAALMFRRELLVRMGFLDPDLFWMEDVDFCFRAGKFGKIIYLPEAEIVHHGGSSSRKNYNVAISNQVISKVKYFKKHAGGFVFFTAAFFTALNICFRTIGFSMLSPFKKIYLIKSKAYVYTLRKFTRYILLKDGKIG